MQFRGVVKLIFANWQLKTTRRLPRLHLPMLSGIPEPRVALEDGFSRLFWNVNCFQAVQIH